MIEYKITPHTNKIGGILADLFAGMINFEYDSSVVINNGLAEPASDDILAHFKNADFKPYTDIVFKDNCRPIDVEFDIIITKYNKVNEAIIRTHLLGIRPIYFSSDEETNEGTICFMFGYIKTKYLL